MFILKIKKLRVEEIKKFAPFPVLGNYRARIQIPASPILDLTVLITELQHPSQPHST